MRSLWKQDDILLLVQHMKKMAGEPHSGMGLSKLAEFYYRHDFLRESNLLIK